MIPSIPIPIDDNQTLAVWLLPLTDDQNLLVAVREQSRDEKYELVFRFRHCSDSRWYTSSFKGTRNEALRAARAALNEYAAKLGKQKQLCTLKEPSA